MTVYASFLSVWFRGRARASFVPCISLRIRYLVRFLLFMPLFPTRTTLPLLVPDSRVHGDGIPSRFPDHAPVPREVGHELRFGRLRVRAGLRERQERIRKRKSAAAARADVHVARPELHAPPAFAQRRRLKRLCDAHFAGNERYRHGDDVRHDDGDRFGVRTLEFLARLTHIRHRSRERLPSRDRPYCAWGGGVPELPRALKQARRDRCFGSGVAFQALNLRVDQPARRVARTTRGRQAFAEEERQGRCLCVVRVEGGARPSTRGSSWPRRMSSRDMGNGRAPRRGARG